VGREYDKRFIVVKIKSKMMTVINSLCYSIHKGGTVMKDENIVQVEREALDWILRLRKESGLTEKELGELAFPETKNPRQKISGLWNARGKGGEPLRLRLGDFCTICHALGKNPAQELLAIWGKINPE
jgi:hypothetical protein